MAVTPSGVDLRTRELKHEWKIAGPSAPEPTALPGLGDRVAMTIEFAFFERREEIWEKRRHTCPILFASEYFVVVSDAKFRLPHISETLPAGVEKNNNAIYSSLL